MIDSIQNKILSALLDKYERSSFFREQTQPTRKIRLAFYNGSGKSDFPYYDIEQSEQRITVNRAVEYLRTLDLLSFVWMKGETNHIIAEVWLNMDNLEYVYRLVGRKAKVAVIDEVLAALAKVQNQIASPWFQAFLCDAYDLISRKRSIVNPIPSNLQEREDLLKAICTIDEMNGTELTERAFSLKRFGDSKQFERTVKTRIVGILRKYQEGDDDARDDDLLRQVGIFKYPELFEFCGNVSLSFGAKTIDFAPLHFGGSVYISDLQNSALEISPDTKRILSIENRANYIEYIRRNKNEHEIVLYHAGQYSPSKKKFFMAIQQAMPIECTWSHWGDIDFGGFSMLARLRREIDATITPYRMDISELSRYSQLAAPIADTYAERLTILAQQDELCDCADCLTYMAANKLRLEQESMLTEMDCKSE